MLPRHHDAAAFQHSKSCAARAPGRTQNYENTNCVVPTVSSKHRSKPPWACSFCFENLSFVFEIETNSQDAENPFCLNN